MDTPQDTTPDLIERLNDIRRDVNDLKMSHTDDIERIQEALNELLHAQILIDNVLM